MFGFRSRRTATRICPPSFRRGLRIEWLEDRTTPSTFFVDNDLTVGLSTLAPAPTDPNTGAAQFQLIDRDGNARLTDGDGVTAVIPGLGATTFTFRTDPAAGAAAGDAGVAFGTIGTALGAAGLTVGADTVFVGVGTYAESLVANSAVDLVGTSSRAADVKITPPTGAGITVTAGGVSLRNLEVTGSAGVGVASTNVIDLTLDNVRVDGNDGAGFSLGGAGAGSTLTLTGVVVTGNAGGGGSVGGFATVNVTAGGTGGATFAATGTTVQVSPAGSSGEVIDLTGAADLNLTGTSSGDTFHLTPAGTGGPTISVVGGAGADVIDLTTTNGLTVAATPGGNGFSGTITPASGPTIDFTGIDTFAQGSTIGGEVVIDADRDGVVDPNDPRLSGTTVYIDLNGDGKLDAGDLSTTTDSNGGFSFGGLPPLSGGAGYSVQVQGVTGTNLGGQPAQTVVVTGLGATTPPVTFVADLTAGGTATGVVFNDANANGRRDAGEGAVAGARLYLDLNQNGTFDSNEPSAFTGSDGVYVLSTLSDDASADVQVMSLPGGYQLPSPFTPPTVSLSGGAVVGANTDVALRQPAGTTGGTVSGTVFIDLNGNGSRDSGEAAVSGVTLYLDLNQNGALDSGEPSAVTASNGSFSLSTPTNDATVNLQVKAPLPAGVQLPNPFNPPAVQLVGGAALAQNVGVRQAPPAAGGRVNGRVFADLNNDGTQQAGENGTRGVTVYLDLNANGRLDAGEPTDRTDNSGNYSLATAQNGAVTVRAVLSPGYIQAAGFPTVVLNGGGLVQGANIGLVANLPPQAAPGQRLAAGFIQGGQAHVQLFGPDGTALANLPVFPGQAMRDVRVAVADVTGDGVEDVIVGTGPGVPTQVVVLDGNTFQQVAQITPFESAFTGGVYVTAGDLTGDGVNDIVVTPDEGGGPRVLVYRGGDPAAAGSFQQVASFFGIDDKNFRGGARAAVADMNRDGVPDLVVAAGFGGGPRVAVYNGTTVLSGSLTRLMNDFFIFEDTLRNGAFIAAGDVDGDGYADLIGGGGPGGGPRVLALSGKDLLAGKALQSKVLGNFFAGDSADRGGVRVTAKDLDGDGRADVATGSGRGDDVQRLQAFKGDRLGGDQAFGSEFEAEDHGGVFVG